MDVENSLNKMMLPTKKGAEISTTKRSIHQGRHLKKIEEGLEIKMNKVLQKGQQKNYTKEQYQKELKNIIQEERSLLKSGERALNKNARPWANTTGGNNGN